MSKIRLPLALLCGALSIGLRAEVVTDGSLGPAGNLPGPDFQITSGLGRQAGQNLFHSFSRFNIGQEESATFSGPGDIRNVIGRVTGGQSSHIDGILRSTIPGADLFLLNPFGLLIGEHATLDVGGSLFVSSADQLEFSDGSRFSATDLDGSVLSVAAPSRFGFVSDAPAPIRLDGAELQVNNGEGITLVGGDLALHGGDGGGSLLASEGRITLSSVSGPAEVALDGEVSAADAAADRGRITLDQGMVLDASGGSGGRIYIRGGNIVAEHATVLSQTLGASPGQGLRIHGSQAVSLDATVIQSATAGSSDAGPIRLEAPAVTIKGDSAVVNSSFGEGRGGRTVIHTDTFRLEQGSVIANEAQDVGDAGTVNIQADTSVELVDVNLEDSDRTIIQVGSEDQGRGGTLRIRAPLVILAGGWLYASAGSDGRAGGIRISADDLTFSPGGAVIANGNAGNGGNIQVDANEDIHVKGDPNGEVVTGFFAFAFGQGDAGSIDIRAGGDIEIVGSAANTIETGIQNSTVAVGGGNAGTIRIEAADLRMEHAQIGANTEGSGNAGRVEIGVSGNLELDEGRIRAISLGVGGSAGDIEVHAGNIEMRDGAEISNEAFLGAFSSGDIRITATSALTIVGRAEPEGSPPGAGRVSTGIFSYTGDVIISAPEILVSDSGQIAARTQNDVPAGRLTVSGERITLLDGGQISGNAIGSSLTDGDAGHVVVSASESIRMSGEIDGRNSGIDAASRSSGDAGLIEVSAPLIVVENGARINTSTGVFTDNSAGGIALRADRVILRNDGGIVSASVGHAGGGGDIGIDAGESLEITDRSFVSAWGGREGHSGRIIIDAPSILLRSGNIETTNTGTQNAGDILIASDRIDILEGSTVQSNTTDAGDAGSVIIRADQMINADGSEISTAADRASGGNIQLKGSTIRLNAAPVTATVAGGAGDGGNVTLRSKAIAATQDSDITARADQGRGGRILIDADVFLRDETIDLDASSNVAGNEGVVEVNAPQLDVSASVKELPADFLDAAAMLRDKCTARSAVDQGSLVVTGMESVPPGPERYLLGTLVDGDDLSPSNEAWGARVAPVPGARLIGGCKPLQPIAH